LFDQVDQGIGFCHAVTQLILRHDHAPYDHGALISLSLDQTAIINDEGAFRVSNVWKKIIIWTGSHTRREYACSKKSGQFWVRTLATPKSRKPPGNPKKPRVLCQEVWNRPWPTPFGRNFVIEGALTTADGRAPKVRAVWFIANRQEIATLATAYPLDA
jgi:hypothetical protein